MKYLIMGAMPLLFISCSSYKVPSSYREQYQVIRTYKCPDKYIMAETAVGDRLCVLSEWQKQEPLKLPDSPPKDSKQVNLSPFIKKRVKTPKKAVKIDCEKAFEIANKCMGVK